MTETNKDKALSRLAKELEKDTKNILNFKGNLLA